MSEPKTALDHASIERAARRILAIEAAAVAALASRVGADFVRAVQLLLGCPGRVVVSGMGKSGVVARKIAATLSSTGTPALFLHPAEALHGDLGMIARGDVLVALSYSGDTQEILDLLGPVKRLGVASIALTGAADSPLARAVDVHLDVGVAVEACPLGLAPSASTTAALAMGDALALSVAEQRGFSEREFAELHPGGTLGKSLTPIERLMHTGESLPCVGPESPFEEVIYEMSRKRLGTAVVVDAAGGLLGLISDGDVRRYLQAHGARVFALKAADLMTRQPTTVAPQELAPVALLRMEEKKITALPVVDGTGRLLGLVHLHDLWTTHLI